MALNYDQSYFIGFAVETMLWGAYTIIFALTLYYSGIRSRVRPVNGLLFGSMIALFLMCTTHFSLVFYNVYQGSMVQFYGIGIENHILEGADVLNYTTDLLGQMILAYRCWILWNRRWSIIVLPLFMSVLSYTFAMIGMGVYRTFASGLPAGASSTKLVNASANIALGVPVGTDLLLTLLIIGRILYLSRTMPNLLSSRRVQAAVSIFAESGAMVIIVQLITSVLVLRGFPSQNILLCMLAQVYGIAPTIIILRIGLGKSIDTTLNPTINTVQYTGTHVAQATMVEKQDSDGGSHNADTKV